VLKPVEDKHVSNDGVELDDIFLRTGTVHIITKYQFQFDLSLNKLLNYSNGNVNYLKNR